MRQVRYWECSKTQALKMISDIEEYAENISEIAFNFKRTGDKTETVYSLNPILKLDAAGKEGFESGNDVKVELSHFEAVLIPRTPEQQIEILKQAGFPVEEYFGTPNDSGVEPTDVDSDTDPADEF